MTIEIQETFEVEAAIDLVWRFLMTPENVVTCLPGASLLEVVDESNFTGRVKIKLGAVTAVYKGNVQFREVDAKRHVLVMAGEGKDPSGGLARAEITVRLALLENGSTEMATDASIDLSGKVMQVGAGMIKGVSHQLFQQFADTAKRRLEAESAASAEPAEPSAGAEPGAVSPAGVGDDEAALRVLPLLLKTIAAAISDFFRRLFGGAKN